ncbi:integrase [Plasmopara halstedii]|uniref:Integrase n=1 Tax=Plasmopara halstedii TaxID=4781 RepID=A0A0P1B0M6_PLAHL|nr:integrase [Plasmopara halstedii]CEG46822.1 integrase [Plasmopara halstedii]|eukprot:XP_024583191.1 integrase [Plasmopara halstedii]
MRIFGCRTFTLVPKEKRLKWDPKSRADIFLGYEEVSKAYRVGSESDSDDDGKRKKISYTGNTSQYITTGRRNQVGLEEAGAPEDFSERRAKRRSVERMASNHTSENKTAPPVFWRASANLIEVDDLSDTTTYQDAVNGSDQIHWRKAICAELDSMKLRGIFRAAKLPTGHQAIELSTHRRKMLQTAIWLQLHRDFCACSQVCYATNGDQLIKTLWLAAGSDGCCYGLLYEVMKEVVYCIIPEGVKINGYFDCLELVNAIYGLKQASRVWNKTFDTFLYSIGFQVSAFDLCLYIKCANEQCVFLLYVDDVLVTDSSLELIALTKNELKARSKMTDCGQCEFLLGIEVVDNVDGSVTLCQRRYIGDILKRFGMMDCKAVVGPMNLNTQLTSSSATTNIEAPFRETVGTLMHLITATRSDIALKRISRYLQGTKSFDIYFNPATRLTSMDIQLQTGLVIMPIESRLSATHFL